MCKECLQSGVWMQTRHYLTQLSWGSVVFVSSTNITPLYSFWPTVGCIFYAQNELFIMPNLLSSGVK